MTIGDRQIHYRQAGKGPPVLLLHQSPTSSRELEPLMKRLAPYHRVLAPDMPGYGASDPWPGPTLRIESLADNIAAFMDAVGIATAGVYGYHTGASVANSLARRHATRVTVTVATGLLCPTPDERHSLLQHYLPPFVPQWDGSHLTWLWSRLTDQSIFFPWFRRLFAARVDMDALPPSAVQASVAEWLRCGERYSDAYAAAFRYQPVEDLPEISTPHYIVDFAADPLFDHLDRLPAGENFSIIRCASAAEAETAAVNLLSRFAGVDADRIPPTPPPTRALRQDYLGTPSAQLRVLRAGGGGEAPLLVLHGAQSSLEACGALVTMLGRDRPTIAIELPGHGHSDRGGLEPGDWSVDGLADLVLHATGVLGISEIELLGLEAGAAIQVALAARTRSAVRAVSLVEAIDVTPDRDLSRSLLASYAQQAPADFYGGHLLRAWHTARAHRLFFPWYERRRAFGVQGDPRVDPISVHRSFADAILAGDAGMSARRAEIRYPLLSRSRSLRCPVHFLALHASPRFTHTRELAARASADFKEFRLEAPE